MAYTLSWSNEVVSVKLNGLVDAEMLTAMAAEITSDYRFDELRKRIYDCTSVDVFKLSLHDIKSFIHIDNAAYLTNPNAHIAIVTHDRAVSESIAFYRHRFSHTDWQVLVCESEAQALAWVPEGDAQTALEQVAESLPDPRSLQ